MDDFLGKIQLFAGAFAPAGYRLCDGSLMSRAENQDLANIMGNNYGGNLTHFQLPDLRPTSPHTGQKHWPGGEPVSIICIRGRFPMT